MSDGKENYSVAIIGIPDHDKKVLSNIFKLSHYRSRSYTLTTLSADAIPEILIVEAGNPAALAEWRTFQSHDGIRASVPTVMVVQSKPESYRYTIQRPFVASRVLRTLEEVATRELASTQTVDVQHHAAPAAAAAAVGSVPTPMPELQQQQRYTALVVDDSMPVRKQIELELKPFDVQVDFAATAERAFTLLDGKNYDIVFLDVVLPGADGYQVCKNIKKNKAKKRTPVIMLTGKSSPFDRIKGKFAGCDTYLTKPVGRDSFQKVVRKYLRD